MSDKQAEINPGRRPRPIIVHQMGKVGSRTVQLSLRKAYETLGRKLPVFHSHILNDFDALEQEAINERTDPSDFLAAVAHGRDMRKKIDEEIQRSWDVITLVRDPISRVVGTFFHNLADFTPGWQERYKSGELAISELQDIFLNVRSIHDWPEYWFDAQLKSVPTFGFDVFAKPFPQQKGYMIYPAAPRARLLLIRLEDLSGCASRAMHEFLGLDEFALYNTNLADEKVYADLYHEFKKSPLPAKYISKMYGTRFARHFYTKTELDSFAKRWAGAQI